MDRIVALQSTREEDIGRHSTKERSFREVYLFYRIACKNSGMIMATNIQLEQLIKVEKQHPLNSKY